MITKHTFINGGKKGLKIIITLAKYIVPSVFVIKIMEHSGVLNIIADYFAPYMVYLGLPGEATLVFLLGQVSMYSSVAAIATLNWTVKQITIAGAIITTCHSFIIESALINKGGGNGLFIASARLVAAILIALILNMVIPGV